MGSLAALAVAIPLIAAALLAATDILGRRVFADAVALVTAVAVTTLCAILLAHTLGGERIVYWLGGWRPNHGVALGISLTVDTFGAGMATLTALIVTAALVFSSRYFDAVGNLFHALMLVFMAGMVGFSLTGDLFNMFVFFELMSTAAYALTGYKIEERGPIQGAINFAVTNSIGAFLVLIGIALLYARTGALNLAQIGTAVSHHPTDTLIVVALLLIIVGFLVKAAIVPLHFWLADAHAVAPVPVCVLFSGVMVELGLFAVARVYWSAFAGAAAPHADALRNVLLALGVLTALVGAVMCLSQRHLKRLLAFSTVSHMGIFLIGFALLSDRGLAGTAMYVLAHGLGKAALFMCVGVLLHRFATVEEHELRGRGRAPGLALVGVTMGVGGITIAAMPMAGSFFGKSLIDGSALALGYWWVPAVATLAAAATGGAILRVTGRVFLGWGGSAPPDTPEAQEARDDGAETLAPHDRTPLVMVVPAVLLMLGALVVGLVPGLVHEIEQAAFHFRDQAGYAAAVLHPPAPMPHAPPPSALKPSDFLYAIASLAGAFALAAAGLRREWSEIRPMAVLRGLHSGHVGDYVTWLVVTLAAVGGTFVLTLR